MFKIALINGLYVFVQDESLQRGIDTVTHPVEEGIDITDHVRRQPISLSLTGEIVGENAADVISQLTKAHHTGVLCTYIGRNHIKNAQIVSFDTSHPNTIWGGCSFTMEIKEVRIAKSAYNEQNTDTVTKATTSAGTQQRQAGATTSSSTSSNSAGSQSSKKVYHTVKSGETAWYLGEKQYKSQGSSMKFITQNNPNAPKVRGDWTTLQVGTKLHVYNKSK